MKKKLIFGENQLEEFIQKVKTSGEILRIDTDTDGEPRWLSVGGTVDNEFCLRKVIKSPEVRVSRHMRAANHVPPTLGRDSIFWVTKGLMDILNEEIKKEDSQVIKLTDLTVKRAFVYFDISDFSKYPMEHQALVINSLGSISSQSEYWDSVQADSALRGKEDSLCIGDGYIYVFKHPKNAVYFAAYLAQLIDFMGSKEMIPIRFHFRSGTHYGEVQRFWDVGKKGFNYIGDGINGGQRVLATIEKSKDDVCYISDETRARLLKEWNSFENVPSFLLNRGRHKDKHDKSWRVWEIDHSNYVPFQNLSPTLIRDDTVIS